MDRIQVLIERLEGDRSQIESAESELLIIGAEAVEPLIEVLVRQEGKKAASAAKILGQLGDERALEPLQMALLARSPLLSGAAVTALLKLSPPDVALDLMNVFPQSGIITQQTIILALQNLGDKRVVPQLIQQLDVMESPVIKCAIIKALGIIGDRSAVPAIQSYVDHENHHVRDWVETSLEMLAVAD